uniref:Uncharacterized protein n=1 Tax=Plectus sambesii TaxID=2011161 RepID=A0A914UQZ5_9BILA
MQLVPELRAVGEALLRSVHRAVVSADCDDAFQVGLLKSRDIDGAEISEEAVVVEETPADTDQPDGNDEGAEEQDDSEQEEEDADDMDIADDDNDNRSATF